MAKQDGKLDKAHNRIHQIFLLDKKKLSHFLKDVCFYFPENILLLLWIVNSRYFKSELSCPGWGGERGLQVHLRDGHQEEVDTPQQQPHHAGHQGEVIYSQYICTLMKMYSENDSKLSYLLWINKKFISYFASLISPRNALFLLTKVSNRYEAKFIKNLDTKYLEPRCWSGEIWL